MNPNTPSVLFDDTPTGYDKADAAAERTESRRKQMLREIRDMMMLKMTTDLFTLIGEVLRKRGFDATSGWLLSSVSWDRIVRVHELHLFLFSMLGLLFGVIIAVVDGEAGQRSFKTITLGDGTVYPALVMLQLAMSTTTLMCVGMIGFKYHLKLLEKRRHWSGVHSYQLAQAVGNSRIESQFENSYSFFRSGMRWKMGAEMLLHLIHPVIWMPIEVYEGMLLTMFLRMYLISDLFFIFSWPYKMRERLYRQNVELQRSGFQLQLSAVIKFMLFTHPIRAILLIQTVVPIIFGVVIYLAERRSNPNLGRLETCMWFVVITFTTVGFGDYVPITYVGKGFAVMVMTFGIMYGIILGGVVNNLMVQSSVQRRVAEYLTRSQASDRQRQEAARVIQLSYRYHKARSGAVMLPWMRRGHKGNYVYAAIKEFRNTRWIMSQSQSTANDPVVDSNMNSIQLNLRSAFYTLNRHKNSSKAFHNIDIAFQEITAALSRRKDEGPSNGLAPLLTPTPRAP